MEKCREFIEQNSENYEENDMVMLQHLPQFIFNQVLSQIDDVRFLDNSHLLVVKSPVCGVLIIEPTRKESYIIIKQFDLPTLILERQTRIMQYRETIFVLGKQALHQIDIINGDVTECKIDDAQICDVQSGK